MFRRFIAATVVAVSLVLSGCGVTLPVPAASPSSTDDYNALVTKYNTLVNSAHLAQHEAEKEGLALEELDNLLKTYSETAQRLVTASDTLVSQPNQSGAADFLGELTSLNGLHLRATNKLTALEQQTLALWSRLATNAPLIYQQGEEKKKELASRQRRYEQLSHALSGIRSLLDHDQKTVTAYARFKAQEYTRTTGRMAPSLNVIPQIVPTARDKEVASAVGAKDAGWVRDQNGKLLPLTDAKSVSEYARNNGFSVVAAEDAVQLSSRTGGTVGFSKNAQSLPSSISDSLSHFKKQLNQNTDALELAFVIDYSGSMSDDIEAVIDGLLSIVKDLENVKKAGRDIRIGIVTFGAPKRELVEQDLTNDLVKTAATLKRILVNYGPNSHSVNPGEASFHGMALAAKGLSWKGQNRMSIVITDEESYEIRTGMTQFVEDTLAALKAQNIQNRIYTIVVNH